MDATPGQYLIDTAWTGTRQLLPQYASVSMPQTPNGSLVVGYWNAASQNNAGALSVTSGGTGQSYDAPWGLKQPSLIVNNWQASNLKLTNVSLNSQTPIQVQAFGPGIPGTNPSTLPIGTPTTIGVLQAMTAMAQPNNMRLTMLSSSNNLSIIVLVGGPLDQGGNNAQVFALNCQGPTPPGYTATPLNSYTFPFNWGSSSLYVANMSPFPAAPVQLTLLSL